ncbi:D-alanine--D-alanine ligase [Ruegeria sp. 2012CJ41-6]|uniref:D-alanine--D-alanine ligase n=2 Tax=Ruegeria spongiae TaxID=2942209 RepID=A0ABT0Q5W7_9RHOB|nr:D-alanine--D-alanine ligase [Ruegeria spongiae]
MSFATGREVAWAMEQLGYGFVELDIAQPFYNDLLEFAPDVAFMGLLGGTGENGSIQGMMEVMQIPYTHSGVAASATAMNKEMSKAIFRDAGLPVPKGGLMQKDEIQKSHAMDAPYIVKPNDDGSSLGGLFMVDDLTGPTPDLSGTSRDVWLVEEYIPGRELTVGVMGDKALAVHQFDIDGLYDYDQKYHHLDSNHILPAPVPPEIEHRLLDLAEQAHRVLGCRGLSRTDFRWDESKGVDGVCILELNTLPGLRRNSNAGEQAAYRGYSFPQLCDWLIQDASLNR